METTLLYCGIGDEISTFTADRVFLYILRYIVIFVRVGYSHPVYNHSIGCPRKNIE